MRLGVQCHALSSLPLGKTWYPLFRRLVGPQEGFGRVRNVIIKNISWGLKAACAQG